jgi:hypothetical protein
MAEKTPAGEGGVDLFGDPWTPPKDPRGRKRHNRLPQLAEKVAVLRATGATEEEIAPSIGVSVPTLRKYYLRELTEGPALALAQLDAVMYAKAKAGNVSAAKYVRDRFKDGDASLAGARAKARAFRPEAPAGAARAAKPGKKEERQAEAERVLDGSSRLAPANAPKLVVSNPR